MRLFRVSVLAFVVGLVSFSYFPQYSHRTYVSENALLPGAANVDYGEDDLSAAVRFTSSLSRLPTLSDRLRYLSRVMSSDLRLETFNSSSVVWGVLRSPKSDGKESLVISARLGRSLDGGRVADSVGMLLSIARYLGEKNWLAKDVVFVVSPGMGETMKWVEEYVFGDARAGVMQAALCLDLAQAARVRKIDLLVHGVNGQLPNLDVMNTVARVADKDGLGGYLDVGEETWFARQVEAVAPETLKPYLPPASLLSFMQRQAVGRPTGDHGFFTKYRVDSLTLRTVAPVRGRGRARDEDENAVTQLDIARVVVGSLRSYNNLLEHLHQSFYLYLLMGPWRYVSIAEYSISIGLLLLPLAALALPAVMSSSFGEQGKGADRRRMLGSLVEVLAVHCLCALAYVVLRTSQATSALAWLGVGFSSVAICSLILVSLIARRISPSGSDRIAWQQFSVLPLVVFTATVSLINYSFCVAFSLVVVPLVLLLSFPFSRSKVIIILQILLCLISSPPAVLLTLSRASAVPLDCLVSDAVSDHLKFGTLVVPFVAMLYAPMNILQLKLLWQALVAPALKKTKTD